MRPPAPPPKLKTARAEVHKDASQQRVICFAKAEAYPNIQSKDDALAQRPDVHPKLRLPLAAREQGTQTLQLAG